MLKVRCWKVNLLLVMSTALEFDSRRYRTGTWLGTTAKHPHKPPPPYLTFWLLSCLISTLEANTHPWRKFLSIFNSIRSQSFWQLGVVVTLTVMVVVVILHRGQEKERFWKEMGKQIGGVVSLIWDSIRQRTETGAWRKVRDSGRF